MNYQMMYKNMKEIYKVKLNYYKKKGSLYEINANQNIEEICSKIKDILENIRD